MAAKKKRSSAEKKMEATIRKLETKLERAEARATRWKEKSKQTQAEVVTLKTRAAKVDKRSSATRDSVRQAAPMLEPATSAGPGPSDRSIPADPTPTTTPNTSWTVAQLRAEARSRGLTGLSTKTKPQLVAALT